MPISGFIKPTDMYMAHYTRQNGIVGLARQNGLVGLARQNDFVRRV